MITADVDIKVVINFSIWADLASPRMAADTFAKTRTMRQKNLFYTESTRDW